MSAFNKVAGDANTGIDSMGHHIVPESPHNKFKIKSQQISKVQIMDQQPFSVIAAEHDSMMSSPIGLKKLADEGEFSELNNKNKIYYRTPNIRKFSNHEFTKG